MKSTPGYGQLFHGCRRACRLINTTSHLKGQPRREIAGVKPCRAPRAKMDGMMNSHAGSVARKARPTQNGRRRATNPMLLRFSLVKACLGLSPTRKLRRC